MHRGHHPRRPDKHEGTSALDQLLLRSVFPSAPFSYFSGMVFYSSRSVCFFLGSAIVPGVGKAVEAADGVTFANTTDRQLANSS